LWKKSEYQNPISLQVTLMTNILNHEKVNQLQKVISKSCLAYFNHRIGLIINCPSQTLLRICNIQKQD